MKKLIIIILLFFCKMVIAQNSSNILKITIPDSVIHIKSKLFIEPYGDDNITFADYEYNFKIKVNIENLTDSAINLYYVYNEVFPSYYRRVKLDSSIFLHEVPLQNYSWEKNGEIEKLFNDFMGFRYVIFNSNNEVIYNYFSLNYRDFKGKPKYSGFSRILWKVNMWYNTKNLKFSIPVVIKKHEKYNTTLKLWVNKRTYKYQKNGRIGHIHVTKSKKIKGENYIGLPKGTYHLYLYYWVDLKPELFGPEYIMTLYPTRLKKEKWFQTYILEDIAKRKKGIPYRGYVKSNTIKLIVE